MAEYDVMGNYTGYDAGYDYEPAYQPVAPTQSPVSYDDFGNPVYNEEEEKRKREAIERQIEEYRRQQEELASEVSRKQEITTYGDGSRTVKTTHEIPGASQRQVPVASPATRPAINPETGEQYQQLVPIAPPAAPTMQATQNTSAYGAGAQQGRRFAADLNNPSGLGWNGQTWNSYATPEEGVEATKNQLGRYLSSQGPMQGKAPTIDNVVSTWVTGGRTPASQIQGGGYRQAVANALAQAGVQLGPNGEIPNTPEARQALTQAITMRETLPQHQGRFAPALGLAQPQAGAGGTTQLAPGATAGMPTQGPQYAGPSQGAEGATAQPVSPITTQGPEQRVAPADQPRMEPNSFDEFGNPVYSQQQADLDSNLKRLESIQNDPKALMNFEGPDWMKENARNRAAELLTASRDEAKAQDTLRNATENDLARYMRSKSEDTNTLRVKGILYALLGNKEMAKKYADKLDTVGTDKYVQGPDGKPYLLRVRADGELLGGFNAETGAKLTDAELVKVGAGAAAGAGKWQTSAEFFQDKDGNVYQAQHNDKGQTRIVDVKTGAPYQGEAKLERLRDVSGRSAAEQKQQYRRENDLFNARKTTANMEYGAKLKALAEVQQAAANRNEPLLNDQELAGFGVTRPDFENFMKTGQAPARPTPAAVAPQAQGVQAVVPPAQGAQAVQGAPGVPTTGRISVEEQKRKEAEEKMGREVTEAERKAFSGKGGEVEAIGQTASDGQAVANARRQQLDIIKSNPSIVNIMNGTGTQYDKARNIIIRAASGAYGNEEKEQLYKDIRGTGMSDAEQGALQEFVNLNTTINAKTLRANAGPGAVSNAEQQANKDANIGNVDRIPAYAAMAGLHRSQFSGDLSASKQAFLDKHPEILTAKQFNTAWQKEESLRLREYQAIAKARFDVMGRPPAADASPEAIKAYRDRVFRAFEAYPAPQFDPVSGKWNYQTANARRAAMAAILGQ